MKGAVPSLSPPWTQLVPDIWYRIYSYLSIPDSLSLIQTCQTLFVHGHAYNHVWKRHVEYLRQYDHQGLLDTLDAFDQKRVAVGYAKLQFISRARGYSPTASPHVMNSAECMHIHVNHDVMTYLRALPVSWVMLYMYVIVDCCVGAYELNTAKCHRDRCTLYNVHIECNNANDWTQRITYDLAAGRGGLSVRKSHFERAETRGGTPYNLWSNSMKMAETWSELIPDQPKTWQRGAETYYPNHWERPWNYPWNQLRNKTPT